MRPAILLALGTLFCVTNCVSRVPANPSTAWLRIDGRIDEQTSKSVLNALAATPAISRVVLNSEGGDEAATLKIARLIRDRQLDVTVDGVCLSACAHLLLASANTITIKDGSTVGFHTNIFGWLAELNRDQDPMFDRYLSDGIDQYRFLVGLNVDPFYLYCAHVAHKPIANPKGLASSSARLLRYNYVELGKDELIAMGFKVASDGRAKVPSASQATPNPTSRAARVIRDWQPGSCQALPKDDWLALEPFLTGDRK